MSATCSNPDGLSQTWNWQHWTVCWQPWAGWSDWHGFNCKLILFLKVVHCLGIFQIVIYVLVKCVWMCKLCFGVSFGACVFVYLHRHRPCANHVEWASFSEAGLCLHARGFLLWCSVTSDVVPGALQEVGRFGSQVADLACFSSHCGRWQLWKVVDVNK